MDPARVSRPPGAPQVSGLSHRVSHIPRPVAALGVRPSGGLLRGTAHQLVNSVGYGSANRVTLSVTHTGPRWRRLWKRYG